MSDEIRHRPFERSSEEDQPAGLSLEGTRRWIDPVPSRGRFHSARRIVAIALLAMFLGLPHLSIGGKPALLLDLAHRQFTFLGLTLLPTDTVLLMVFGAGFVITVFFFTAVFGRIWCGWTCPQTIYLEWVFRPLETLVEGPPAVRRRRDAGGWTADRLRRKATKYAAYVVVGALMAATFAAYFVSWDGVVAALADPAQGKGTLLAIGLVTALEVLDFAFLREQMCTLACPYGRLQNVLYDADTLLVGYDATRGEPRGRLERGDGPRTHGDCIDCGRCVQTCPTGIDIRRGLQMECVACTQCIDACDDVMVRIGRPRGLVRYASQRELAGGRLRFVRPRLLVYAAILLAVYVVFWFLLLGRPAGSVEILRGSTSPFQELSTGQVASQLRMRFTNHLATNQAFSVSLEAPAGAELAGGDEPLVVGPGEVETLTVAVKTPRSEFSDGRVTARFVIRSDAGLTVEREHLLLGPYGD